VLDAKGNIAENAKIPVTVEAAGNITFMHMDNGSLRAALVKRRFA
jgi:hypothetical protein